MKCVKLIVGSSESEVDLSVQILITEITREIRAISPFPRSYL